MPAAKFKASCLRLMREVERTGESLLITNRQRPLVRIEALDKPRAARLGALQGEVEIVGDIVHGDFPDEWE